MKLLYFLFITVVAVNTDAWSMVVLYGYGYKNAIRTCYTASKRCYKSNYDLQDIGQIVKKTDALFSHVPGYKKVVKNLHASFNESSKGALYELQVALEFHSRGHKICAFEKIYKDEKNGCMCELDIITDLCGIECKNINWHSAEKWPKVIPKMHKQIKDQQALINSGVVGVSQYIFCSKNEIPLIECDWLCEQGVHYLVYAPHDIIH
jgi:hypothetical protein